MIRAFQWDLARQVERLDWLLSQLPRYAEWGYQELYLHLEDAVHYPSLPEVARANAYTHRELGKLVDAAQRVGIGVVPIVNLLGHTQYLIKTPGLRDLNELRHPDGTPQERGQICPLHPRTLEVADQLFNDVRAFCTAGKIHVGLDESFHLGKHPASREEVQNIGLAAHFARYAGRLHALVSAQGFRMGLWADMLALLPEAIPLLPRGMIAYDWYYYPFPRHPRMELYNYREYDLAPALRDHGIEYWGCPMNGAFRHEPLPIFRERLENICSWWKRCQRVGAAGFLVTSWEAYHLAIEMTTGIDAAAACLWNEPAIDEPATMLAAGFKRYFRQRSGRRKPNASELRAWTQAALACDQYPFAGYARWEINERWDGTSTREPFVRYAAERRFFARLQRRALPAPFADSVTFRRYLADRDVFVRSAARGVWRLRRLLKKLEPTLSLTESTSAAPRTEASATSMLNPGGLCSVRAALDIANPPSPAMPEQPRSRNCGRALQRISSPSVAREIAELIAAASAFARALVLGRAAARAMWARSRDRATPSPNGVIVATDATRLKTWKQWLSRCRRNPRLALADTPVCGAWQLQFSVHNFAPALQKVIVEQQGDGGAWQMLLGRFTIEFRAEAARPHSRVKREFAVPVADPQKALRIAVRGLGQVAIANVELTDGTKFLRPRDWTASKRKIIGTPAPHHGLPTIDWNHNSDAVNLTFCD